MLTFLPLYLTRSFSTLGENTPGFVVTVTGVVASLFTLGSGIIFDRMPARGVWILAGLLFAATVAVVVGFYLSDSFYLTCVFVVMTVTAASAANLSCFKLLDTVCPEDAAATVGLMETAGNVIGFALPLSFTLLSHVSLVAIVLLALAASALVVFAVLFLCTKR